MRNLFATTFIAVAFLASCGPQLADLTNKKKSDDTEETKKTETVKIPITVSQQTSQPAGLWLGGAATTYEIKVEGCVSGYAPTATEANATISLYKYDRSCVAKLKKFLFDSVTWVPSVGNPFTTWQVGETATFVNELDALEKILVKVTGQLSNPIAGTETISYAFSEIAAGPDETIADTVVSDSHAISVAGQGAPSFQVKAVSYTGMTATGAGQFVFKLECSVAMTGTGATAACKDTDMINLRYKLVEDTYSGTLTLAQADAIFSGDEIAVDTSSPTELLGLNQGGLLNGGFTTKTGASVLSGPNQMHLKPNMLLILQAADTSFQYFNVDVTTLVP